jgi:hypothetical protein
MITPQVKLSLPTAVDALAFPSQPLLTPWQLDEPYLFSDTDFQNSWSTHLAARYADSYCQPPMVVYRRGLVNPAFGCRIATTTGWHFASWSQDMTPAFWQAFSNFGATNTRWDFLRMVWSSSRLSVQDFTPLAGKSSVTLPYDVDYWIDLKFGWDGYLAGMSKQYAKGVKRRFKRVEHQQVEFLSDCNPKSVQPFMGEFKRYHCDRWKERGQVSFLEDEQERLFLTDWFTQLAERGQLSLNHLLINDQVVNMSVSVTQGKRLWSLLTTNSGLYQEYAPGMLGLYLELQAAAEQGIESVCLGPGSADDYKANVSSFSVPRYITKMANPASITGIGYLRYLKHRHEMPDTFRSLYTRSLVGWRNRGR